MSMSFGLATTLSTSQKLTPQMQQAIKLLQLSSLELAQEVQAKLDSNPLLERIEDDDDDNDEYGKSDDEPLNEFGEPLTLDSWNQHASVDAFSTSSTTSSGDDDNPSEYDNDFSDSLDKLQQSSFDDDAIDSDALGGEGYSSFDTDNYTSVAKSSGSSTNDEFDSYQGSTSATIQDHVRWQLNFKHLSETDTLIAEYLMDSMDDMGFVRLDIDELLQSFDTMASFYQWDERVEHDEVMAVLRIIQSCDPLGVGARNLNECLALQLSKLDTNTKYLKEAKALLSASEHLVSNNI